MAALRLVMECAELWYDPAAWRRHLVEGLLDLTHSGVAGLELIQFSDHHPGGEALTLVTAGWPDERSHAGFHAALDCDAHERGLPQEVYQHIFAGLASRGEVEAAPHEIVGEREWHHSLFFERCFEPYGPQDVCASFRTMPKPGQIGVLNLNRWKGQERIQPWQESLMRLVHETLAPLVGTRLAVEGQRSTDGLSPRRKQVLDLLLQGLSEKEIAHRLGIAPATAHQYVGDLYRWFRVRSRAELMAYFIRRRPLDDAEEAEGSPPPGR